MRDWMVRVSSPTAEVAREPRITAAMSSNIAVTAAEPPRETIEHPLHYTASLSINLNLAESD